MKITAFTCSDLDAMFSCWREIWLTHLLSYSTSSLHPTLNEHHTSTITELSSAKPNVLGIHMGGIWGKERELVVSYRHVTTPHLKYLEARPRICFRDQTKIATFLPLISITSDGVPQHSL